MRRTDPLLRPTVSFGALLLCAALSAQALAPKGTPRPPALWEGGKAASFLLPVHPDRLDDWVLRAVVEPVARPTVVRLRALRGKDSQELAFLSFEVRGTGSGLEDGKTYRCLAPLDPNARTTDASRLLLMGWRASSGGRLVVEPRSRLDHLMQDKGTAVQTEPGTLFVAALLPTAARRPLSAEDARAAVYLNLAETLKGAPPSAVRQVTGALAALPPEGSFVMSTIEGSASLPWVRTRLSALLAALPTPTALERFRYGGLLAEWDRPARALAYLKALPALKREIALDPKRDPMSIRRPGDARDDLTFVGSLNLVEGLDPDAVFDAVWNTSLRDMVIDPNMAKKAPSLENQRRVLNFLSDPSLESRAMAYRLLADWYSDWSRSAQAVVRWSEAEQRPKIENEEALREYWMNKLDPAHP